MMLLNKPRWLSPYQPSRDHPRLPLSQILRWRKWNRWEDRCSRCSRQATDSPRLQPSNSSSKWWCSRWARWCKWCRLWWLLLLINNSSLSQHHQCSHLNSCSQIQTNSNSSRCPKLRLPLRMILLPTYLTQWPQQSLLLSRITLLLQAIPSTWIKTLDRLSNNLTILLTSEKKLCN